MNIASIDIYRYEIPLARPLVLDSESLDARTGFVVRVEDDKGRAGIGDVAPLPGVSPESLDEALDATIRLCRGVWLGETEHIRAIVSSFEETPSAPMGFFMAQDMLLAQIDGVSLADQLGGQSRDVVSLNALIDWNADDATLERVKREGYATAKLKVGRCAIEEDARRVHAAAAALPGVTLRLDANQSWNMAQAMQFANAVRDCPIEYIEEPLRDPELIGDFVGDTGIPVALDESVVHHIHHLGTLQRTQGVSAVVLKPTLLGGLANVVEFAREAHLLGMTPVVSACFESGVGIGGLAHLAAALTVEDVPAGLDTVAWIAKDVLNTPIKVVDGKMRLSQVDDALRSFNPDGLERVFHA